MPTLTTTTFFLDILVDKIRLEKAIRSVKNKNWKRRNKTIVDKNFRENNRKRRNKTIYKYPDEYRENPKKIDDKTQEQKNLPR